ncbi:baseplate J/gp47 family protein [Pseudogulbenkiania ferrooxidans]|uniref:Baseplate J family protein n=1 Tax=Pseudogulbenkiania ferrooxidans 2002 TaxID=279714 RepID=B9Z2Z3_9NEIS|nr:baseplate J/gp47 family protein [Pseudogulbenkiania ferrooxidans]EEG08946.1 Baseplate J family protein [Pseudogulbenkiania ferrooxidans 2002]
MTFATKTLPDIRDDYLRELSSNDSSQHTAPDSDNYQHASAVGSVVEGAYAHQAWLKRQLSAEDCDDDILLLYARDRGLNLKPATYAQGTLVLQGTAGLSVPVGTVALRSDGSSYRTTAEAVADANGLARPPAIAIVAGTDGNAADGTSITLQIAPEGFQPKGTLEDMDGGQPQESISALRARYLELIRRPPAGGNKYDWPRWAKEVPGVEQAWCFPTRRGLGTVDVVILAAKGALPSAELIEAVHLYLAEQRNVTGKNYLVLAPTLHPVDIHVRIKLLAGYTREQVSAAIASALQDYFSRLIPGETAIRSSIETIISTLAGVADREVLTPPANVTATVDANVVEWLTLGAVLVELMP